MPYNKHPIFKGEGDLFFIQVCDDRTCKAELAVTGTQ